MSWSARDWSRQAFARAVSGEDGGINLALAALLLALDRYPALDVPAALGRLDALAAGAAPSVLGAEGPEDTLRRLAAYLHGEVGLDGSPAAYASPAGCFLNEALERRTGLPITLSAIYLEVGWRLGLPLAGVGLPGHFVITYQDPERASDAGGLRYCDPFRKGGLLTAEGCRALVAEGVGAGAPFLLEYLRGVSRRAILYRMLSNMKAMYLRGGEPRLALWATDRMLLVAPGNSRELRDRGLLHYAVGSYDRAVGDLLAYLSLQPPAPDAPVVRRQLDAASRRSGVLN